MAVVELELLHHHVAALGTALDFSHLLWCTEPGQCWAVVGSGMLCLARWLEMRFRPCFPTLDGCSHETLAENHRLAPLGTVAGVTATEPPLAEA